MSELLCSTLHNACHSNVGMGVPGVGRKNVSWGLAARFSRDGTIRREGNKHILLKSFDLR